MEYCVLHLFMCANVDANVSFSMSHVLACVRGWLSNPVQVATHAAGHRHVYCSGQDAQIKDGVSGGGGEVEVDDGVRER